MANHHDKLFRAVFGDPSEVRGLLSSLLSPVLGSGADFRTLRRAPGSLVDEHLVERHTDLLFELQVDGRRSYVLVLLEHQSSSDRFMPLRLLGYVMRIWEQHRHEHSDRSVLPLVCPVVVHHSRAGWRGPRALRELVDIPDTSAASVGRLVPDFEFVLLDLTEHDDAQLREILVTDLAGLVASALKHAPYDANFLESFPCWVDAWRRAARAPSGLVALTMVTRYVLDVCESVTVDDFHAVLESCVGSDVAETVMTPADQLRQEGRMEGRMELVLKQLTLRFGAVDREVAQRLQGASDEDLDAIGQRLLFAGSLEEALGA